MLKHLAMLVENVSYRVNVPEGIDRSVQEGPYKLILVQISRCCEPYHECVINHFDYPAEQEDGELQYDRLNLEREVIL